MGIKETLCLADQNIDKEHDKSINEIIPPNCDIDNGEVYNVITGETIKDL